MIAFQQIRKIREKALPSKNEKSTSHAVPRLVRDEIMFVLVCVWGEGCYIPFIQHLLKILNVFFPDQGDFDARKKKIIRVKYGTLICLLVVKILRI